jgi:hypothetical protein
LGQAREVSGGQRQPHFAGIGGRYAIQQVAAELREPRDVGLYRFWSGGVGHAPTMRP